MDVIETAINRRVSESDRMEETQILNVHRDLSPSTQQQLLQELTAARDKNKTLEQDKKALEDKQVALLDEIDVLKSRLNKIVGIGVGTQQPPNALLTRSSHSPTPSLPGPRVVLQFPPSAPQGM